MSKYYKAEDVIAFLNLHCPKDMWEYQIADLPTIEVSKDCISRADLIQDLRKDAERVEMEEFANDTVWRTIGNAPSVISQVPSEDAISRANLIKSFLADCECESREEAVAVTLKLEDMLELIEDAPSVIPQVPNEDAVSRAYLEQEIENQIMPPIDKEGYWRGWNNALGKVVELIEDAPPVVPKPKEGEWIPCSEKLPQACQEVQLTCEVRPVGRKPFRYVCTAEWIPRFCQEALSVNWDDETTEYCEEDDEYYPLEGWYECIRNWDDYSLVGVADFAIAWKPVEEPYKGAE